LNDAFYFYELTCGICGHQEYVGNISSSLWVTKAAKSTFVLWLCGITCC